MRPRPHRSPVPPGLRKARPDGRARGPGARNGVIPPVVASVLALTPAAGAWGQVHRAGSDSLAPARTALYAEAWGVSSVASLNLERTLWMHGRWQVSARAGIGTITLRDFTRRFNPDLVLPIGAYGCHGGRVAAELGAGAALTSLVHPDPDTFAPERSQHVHGWLSAGVRTGGTRKGIFARAAFNLLFEFGRMSHTAGIGIGYRF